MRFYTAIRRDEAVGYGLSIHGQFYIWLLEDHEAKAVADYRSAEYGLSLRILRCRITDIPPELRAKILADRQNMNAQMAPPATPPRPHDEVKEQPSRRWQWRRWK